MRIIVLTHSETSVDPSVDILVRAAVHYQRHYHYRRLAETGIPLLFDH